MAHLPLEMVLNHGNHSMLYVLLFGCQVCCGVLFFEFGGQLFDDDVGVADFFTVQLNKRQQTSFGSELGVVVNALEKGVKRKHIVR